MKKAINPVWALLIGGLIGIVVMIPLVIHDPRMIAADTQPALCPLPAHLAVGQQWFITRGNDSPELLPVRIAYLTDTVVGWAVELPEIVLTKDEVSFFSRAILPTSGMCFIWQRTREDLQPDTSF